MEGDSYSTLTALSNQPSAAPSGAIWSREDYGPSMHHTRLPSANGRLMSRVSTEHDSISHVSCHKQTYRSLLDIPAEVRTEILKLLLWQFIPIRNRRVFSLEDDDDEYFGTIPSKNYHFHPAILRVCRQLNDEGTRLLYDNTLVMSVWRNPWERDFVTVLDEINYSESSNQIVQKFEKLHVELYFRSYDHKDASEPVGEYECELVRQQISSLTYRRLAKLPKLRQLSIELMKGMSSFDVTNRIGEKLLFPLGRVRDLDSIKFYGVSDRFATGMNLLMMGNDGSREMVRMLDKLENVAYSLGLDIREFDEMVQEAREAICECDWDKFQMSRTRTIYRLVAFVCQQVSAGTEMLGDVFRMISSEYAQLREWEIQDIVRHRMRTVNA